MLKPINSIIKDSIGNIIYRGNVVTGTVAVDNGDGSYDVFISESDRAYPKIFTLSRNPNLEVGDKVRILYKNGCKEMPIILPPVTVKPIAVGRIFVYFYLTSTTSYIESYDNNGVLIASFIINEIPDRSNAMCIDSDDNIYYIDIAGGNFNIIRKLDKDGNLLLSKTITRGEAIAIGPDGFIYERGYDSNWNAHIIKRNRSDLGIVSKMAFPYVDRYKGLVLDSDGYIYSYQSYTDLLEKWDFTSATRIAYRAMTLDRVSLAIVGNFVGGNTTYPSPNHAWTIPKSLDEDITDWTLDGVTLPYATGSIGGDFLFGGNYPGQIGRYKSDRTKVWSINSSGDSNVIEQIAAYPF